MESSRQQVHSSSEAGAEVSRRISPVELRITAANQVWNHGLALRAAGAQPRRCRFCRPQDGRTTSRTDRNAAITSSVVPSIPTLSTATVPPHVWGLLRRVGAVAVLDWSQGSGIISPLAAAQAVGYHSYPSAIALCRSPSGF
jgi:hypothetical protein